jgi:hypothetical protein
MVAKANTQTVCKPRLPIGLTVVAGLATITLAGVDDGLAQQPRSPGGDLQQCEGIDDQSLRLRCLEGLATRLEATTKSSSIGIGSWRLVHTANPSGGVDAVSIMQTADPSKSDLDLAGLMFRCANVSIETVVVLVRPFPPRAHPSVTVAAGGKSQTFAATVAPPGAALRLPPEATLLAAGPWQSAAELTVEIADESPIHGVISLKGLGAAYRALLTSCRQQ